MVAETTFVRGPILYMLETKVSLRLATAFETKAAFKHFQMLESFHCATEKIANMMR